MGPTKHNKQAAGELQASMQAKRRRRCLAGGGGGGQQTNITLTSMWSSAVQNIKNKLYLYKITKLMSKLLICELKFIPNYIFT